VLALLALRALGAGAPPLRGQQPSVDILAYHFRIDIPDTGTTIRGLGSVFFEPRAGWDDTLRLDLVGMSVRRVFDVNTLRLLPIRYDGRMLKVVIRGARARPPSGRRGVVVEYSGSPRDGLIIRDNARGRRSAFGDNWPDRARYWLPTVDHPSDKARVLWSIRVPRGWQGVANQPECAPPPPVPPRRCNESAPIPTYAMVLGATQLARSIHRPLLRGRDAVPIEVWTYREDSAFADSVPFRRATDIAATLQRIVGPFPYARLSHVQSSTRYGGMENSTVIFYSESSYVHRTMREGVVRHETAHQWFGDAVTPADWAHLWLSEGFATYFDGVTAAALDGDSVLRPFMRRARESYIGSNVVDRPVIDTLETDPNRLLNANSYQKGAWVLHMLRGEVSDGRFFRGVREYYRRYRDSSVTTDRFRREMERASGTSLGWFFDQWLRQPGYPQLDVAWRADSAAGHAYLTIRQVQPAAWGRYRLPRVTVDFVLSGGRTERRTFVVDPQFAEQVASFPLPAVPVEVVVDPDGQLLLTARVHR